jgi:hypothetical protein
MFHLIYSHRFKGSLAILNIMSLLLNLYEGETHPIAYIHQILPHDHLQVSSAVYLVHQLVLH